MSLTIQKASFWKRISAWLFDAIITVMLTVGFATILSATLNYNKQNTKLQNYYTEYETTYGVDFDITEEDYNKLSEEAKTNYQKAQNDFRKDTRVQKIYQTLFLYTLIIVSISLLIGILVVQFIVPLFFKNGQTLGKKIFGIALMRSNSVKITNFVLFVRSIFGLYTIETIFPIALIIMMYFGLMGGVGTITILLLFGLQVCVLIANRNRTAIHDLLADTVVVDMASQRIFDTESDMLAYKKELHEQEVQKKDYI